MPWIAAEPAEVLDDKLQRWLASSSPYLVRVALVVSVGLVHQPIPSHFAPIIRVLQIALDKLDFSNSEVDSAIGWLLANVWSIAPLLVQDWLATHGDNLSRKVFRIAVGRMPSPIRQQLILELKLRQATQRLAGGQAKKH